MHFGVINGYPTNSNNHHCYVFKMFYSENIIYFLKASFLVYTFPFALSDCVFPKNPPANGWYKYSSPSDANLTIAPETYILRFECSPSYTLHGRRASLCFNSKWTHKQPSCLKMQCSTPVIIANGSYILTNAKNGAPTVGATARYSCNVGFKLENPEDSQLLCHWYNDVNAAQWMGVIPNCKKKDACPEPKVSEDGNRVGNCCFEGDTLLYSCNEDYQLVGNDTLQCLSGGQWTSRRPLCKPLEYHCEPPPLILNGFVMGDRQGDYYLPYDEVEVRCKPGYKYTESSIFVMCEEDTGWDSPFFHCTEAFCDAPKSIVRGTIPEIEKMNGTSFPYNFEITYVCDAGYRLIGDSWRFCTTKGWSGVNPYCEEIRCPDPGFPAHGSRVGSNFSTESKVNFKCFSEYELIGSFERYCKPNGQWSGELARCNHPSNYCPDPGTPINGVKNSSTYELNETIGFKCYAGYTLLGSESRTCLSNGTWSGSEVKCMGPHDYDSNAKVSEILKAAIAQKEAEQKLQLEEYEKSLNSSFSLARVLHVGFEERLILYFAFDASGSVGPNNFRRSIELAKAIVTKIGISESGTRAGALTFSSTADVKFLPMEFKTTTEVIAALDTMDYTGGGTAASSALSEIRMGMMPLVKHNLMQKTIKSVIFILTDGKANMGGDPQEQADFLKKVGVEIYCIGITNTVLQDSLYRIASDEKEEHVFVLQNYAAYHFLAEQIVNGTIDYSKCGLGLETLGSLTSQPVGKIVGGEKATESWSWMAGLYFKSEKSSQPELKCGGSIIHRRFILTAAHCMYTSMFKQLREPENIIVRLGLTDVNNMSSLEQFEVAKFINHKDYRPGAVFDYDIALIKLKRPIAYTAYIRPICLPDISVSDSLYRSSEIAVAIGWGHAGKVKQSEMLKATQSEDVLKVVLLPIQTEERCQQGIPDTTRYTFTSRMMCAGDGTGGNDTCKGDSGGPLMQSLMDNETGNVYWTQVGITSWGIGCGQPNRYGYYTHVRKLITWIKDTIQAEDFRE